MTYLQTYSQLREAFSGEEPQAPLGPGLWLQNLTFVSGGLRCPGQEGAPPPADLLALLPGGTDLSSLFSVPDGDISENREFRYHVVRPDGAPGRGAIILLHGFNERHWDKYLPMAAFLAGRTGKSVILFPIAFHMNRAPALWNDARVMRKVSQWRKSVHPNVLESTLSNAAISIRLHQDPARFFWSGLETYENIVSLSRTIIGGGHPAFDGPATVDFFTYSIGSFLGEIVMLADEDSLFGDSRLAIFCGGPVFNRLSPVSKFILDSEASVSLYSFLIEHLDSHRRNAPLLDGLLGSPGVGANFRAMLNYRLDREYREGRLRDMAGRIMALALARDEVVPPFEIINTLNGSARDIDVRVRVADPAYPYRHEDPFPTSQRHELEVDEWFGRIMGEFSDFLA